MRAATTPALPRSTAFAALSPHEQYDRLAAKYPRKAAAVVEAMVLMWEDQERERRSRTARQARARLKDR